MRIFIFIVAAFCTSVPVFSFEDEDNDSFGRISAIKHFSFNKVVDLGHKVINHHKDISIGPGGISHQKHFSVVKKFPKKTASFHDEPSHFVHSDDAHPAKPTFIDVRGETSGDAVTFESIPKENFAPKYQTTTKSENFAINSQHNFAVSKTSQVHTSSSGKFRSFDEDDNDDDDGDDLDDSLFDHIHPGSNFGNAIH